MRGGKLLLTALAMSAALSGTAAAQVPDGSDDPFFWLEQTEGERVDAWVAEQNGYSLGVLQGDPRYQPLHDQALAILEARDRIAVPGFNRDGTIDNFWQDQTSVRGVWRRTTLESYLSDQPQWRTILDFDALARAENANWVYKGATCQTPNDDICLISLSDGGKDAVTIREFDASTGRFVEGGFVLPESKGGATWLSNDELLVYRDFGEGSLSTSGYPLVVKRLRRGQSLDQAVEIYRGQPDDLAASAYTLRDPDGRLRAVIVERTIAYYNSERFVLTPEGLKPFALPRDAEVQALLGDRLIVRLLSDWAMPSGDSFRQGDLVAVDLDAFIADPATARGELVLRPGARDSIQDVTTTRNQLLVSLYENVRGSIYVLRPEGATEAGWTRTRLPLPENVSVGLGSTSETTDQLFVNVTGYLTPPTLYLADAAAAQTQVAKTSPERFSAEGLTVEQFQARSADGTMVPYFVVHRADMPLNGATPTLLYGYGGFQNALLPGYSATVGKLWLERGGAYVVANIRGGGEFGPAWHQAALRQNRQRTHEDFIAVAEDLIARQITSPRRLGMMGGSQGGLLVGAVLTQRPELFNAAVIQVPLFDMLRYTQIGAGASWRGEYGDPAIPEQRAWIEEYSPYQRLQAGQPYPEVFIHTSTKDDRVHPSHGRKAAARLDQLGYPVLYYENTDGGHAAGANLRETARRMALEYTYLTRRLMD
ncbi:prolyl oligopeptidase family serine peptidase [Brevundimonas sp. 2R-24]|uniref:Prolyl oligopeptidase family serine peptidase n=1 Tax=Peiella sedimenti TaxID=3061083 RepID=A0ABT8SNS5_9CAUL|nr:prolyl oligopeptidase family serine peptidase [Caulobacteraceae bacterium XZ-24]